MEGQLKPRRCIRLMPNAKRCTAVTRNFGQVCNRCARLDQIQAAKPDEKIQSKPEAS